MKAENVFKFVSIRPPEPDEELNQLEGDEDTIVLVTETIGRKHADPTVHPRSVRLAAGSELAQSDRYFSISERGRVLLAGARDLRWMFRDSSAGLPWETFRTQVYALLAPGNSGDVALERFLASNEYASLKQSLWLSYYAAVLNPHEYPQHREIISSWLLLLHMFEANDEAVYRTRVQQLPKTRPAVPYAFFAASPKQERPEEEVEKPENLRVEQWKELQSRIDKLYEVREALHILFVAKLQQFEQRRLTERTTPQNTRGFFGLRNRRDVAVDIDPMQYAPWCISQNDLVHFAEAFRIVRDIGILPETSSLPDVIARIDQAIASVSAQVDALKSREELMREGTTFVRVRRRRSLEQQ